MKIVLYTKPGENPDQIAEQAKSIIESATGNSCHVRIVGKGLNLMTPTNLAEGPFVSK